MTKLNEMSLLGLADFYSFCDSKHDEHGREECVKEIRRRQAMLDAADVLINHRLICVRCYNPEDYARECGNDCDCSCHPLRAAYTAAKGTP